MSDIININIDSKHVQNAMNRKNGIKSKRTCTNNWEKEDKEFLLNIDNHYNIIQKMYENNDFKSKDNIIKEFKRKLNSYKNQDQKKGRYIKSEFITINELVNKLKKSDLKCHYCLKKVKLIYENVRDPEQWTLDRLDNNISHTDSNTVIADLRCNLQRRLKDEEKFLCDKQLKIIMLDTPK